MRDPRARNAVATAIEDIVDFRKRELSRERGRPTARARGPVRDVALSVCCQYGTHRSVTIAERIGEGLVEMGLGVRVRVRHVHRQRGYKEAR